MVAFAEEKETSLRISREDYLEWESKQEDKNEYHNGVIAKRAVGMNFTHARINTRVVSLIHLQLQDSDYDVFACGMRVYLPDCNCYFYPDGSISREGRYEIMGEEEYSLLNPMVIIEVTSPATKVFDRTEKFDCYKTLDSLQTYVLIAQAAPRIEVFERQASGAWTATVSEGTDATAKLERIGCELQLKNVYARVDFADAADE